MSYVLFGDDVVFYQRLLKIQGLYRGRLDGIWGKKTEKASSLFERETDRIMDLYGYFDSRTESHIYGLTLRAQVLAREFMTRLIDAGFNAKIISGTRTYEEQNRLFRQGRYGNPGDIVTKARGGKSNHNFGIGWDIGLFTAAGGYSKNNADYVAAAEAAMVDELEWGGDWVGFYDPPHYQVSTGYELEVVRAKFEAGETLFA